MYIVDSPVVSQGRIILGAAQNLLCLDLATGTLLWRYPKKANGGGWGFSSTATIDNDRVYVLDPAGKFICLDLYSEKKGPRSDGAHEGLVLWTYDTNKLGFRRHYTACSSPLILGDYIYVGTSSERLLECNEDRYLPLAPSLVALDKHTGQLVARDDEQIGARLFKGQWSSPSSGVVNGQTQIYYGGGDGFCYAFEPVDPAAKVNSGQFITTKLRRQISRYIVLDAKASPPEILAAKAAAIEEMKKIERATGIPSGEVRMSAPGSPTMGSSDLEARVPDVPCMKKIWSCDCNPPGYREDANGVPIRCSGYGCPGSASEILATPVFYQNKVFVAIGQNAVLGTGRGNLVCIDATRKGDLKAGQWLWNYDGIKRSVSTVSIADGLVYACDVTATVHCLDAQTGQKYWAYPCLDAETGRNTNVCWASTVVADGKVFIVTRKGLFILATGREPKLLGTVKLTSINCYATPCAAGKTLLVCDSKHLWAVEDQGAVAPAPKRKAELAPLAASAMPAAAAPPANVGTPDWPQFRGPSGNGTACAEADPPTKFDLAKDRRYSSLVPAGGRSSPIIWGKRLYLTGGDNCIMAFDRETGKLQWKTVLDVPPPKAEPSKDGPEADVGHQEAGGAAPTPVTDGRFVYAFFGNGIVGCVDTAGKPVWAKRLVSRGPQNTYGLAASPVLYGDLLIQTVDRGGDARDKQSFLVALRTKDGTEAWRQSRGVVSCWTTPLVVPGPHGDVLVTTAPPQVIAYDPKIGTELWHAKGTSNGELSASPVQCGSGVVAVAASDGLTAFQVGGRGDVTKSGLVWKSDCEPQVSSPVSGNGLCYLIVDDTLYCVDAATGKDRWNLELKGQFYASPVMAKNRLYAINREGVLFVVSSDGKKLDEVELGKTVEATPAIFGGSIYIRTGDSLLSLGHP